MADYIARRAFLRHGLIGSAATLAASSGLLPWERGAAHAADGGLRVVKVEGTARERGEQYGEQARESIQTLVQAWKALTEQTAGMPADDLVAAFLGSTQFDEAIMTHTPWLWEELNGIALGAQVPLRTLLALNVPDELEGFSIFQALREAPPSDSCTAVGIFNRPGKPPIIGQNMDIPSGTEGFELLLDITHSETGHMEKAFSVSGLVRVVGLSGAPVGVVNNSLRQLDIRPDGLPVNFVVGGLLGQPSYGDATDFIQRIPHAVGHNYVIGGPEKVTSWECSANKVVEFVPAGHDNLVYHTNHPFVNDDRNMYDALVKVLGDEAPPFASDSSMARHAAVEAWLAELPGEATAEHIKALLSSRANAELPVCRPHQPDDPGATFTASSLLMELSTPPVLHITAGPPSETPYEVFRFA